MRKFECIVIYPTNIIIISFFKIKGFIRTGYSIDRRYFCSFNCNTSLYRSWLSIVDSIISKKFYRSWSPTDSYILCISGRERRVNYWLPIVVEFKGDIVLYFISIAESNCLSQILKLCNIHFHGHGRIWITSTEHVSHDTSFFRVSCLTHTFHHTSWTRKTII